MNLKHIRKQVVLLMAKRDKIKKDKGIMRTCKPPGRGSTVTAFVKGVGGTSLHPLFFSPVMQEVSDPPLQSRAEASTFLRQRKRERESVKIQEN